MCQSWVLRALLKNSTVKIIPIKSADRFVALIVRGSAIQGSISTAVVLQNTTCSNTAFRNSFDALLLEPRKKVRFQFSFQAH
jgi:hypothetical protein